MAWGCNDIDDRVLLFLLRKPWRRRRGRIDRASTSGGPSPFGTYYCVNYDDVWHYLKVNNMRKPWSLISVSRRARIERTRANKLS